MPNERPLSKKKVTQQTISISPALKNRIEQYVMENKQKYPNDKRFKSVSSFYNSVLEKVMESLEQSKTLDDLSALADTEIKDFFSKISFNALIPYYENAIKTNRYENPTLEKNTFFYFTLRRLYLSRLDPYDVTSIKNIFNRVRNYLISNNLTKEFRLDLFTGKSRKDLTGTFEHAGLYKNLCFENYKYAAALFGLLGAEITDFVYSIKNNYCRFDLRATDLFYKKELAKFERIKIMNHNLSYLINFNRLINDKDYYLWMKLASDKQAIITFINEDVQDKWINLIEKEIQKFGDIEDLHLTTLKLFEKFHWIEIESEELLLFQIKLPKSRYEKEINYLFEVLSKISDIIHKNGKYQIKRSIK
ncbi:MAG: hypothetical protein ACFE9Z_12030 [Promethearchaeota archaeon]